MNFFFDCNLSLYIARALDDLDRVHNIRHQLDDRRFTHSTSDISLIQTVASDPERWVWVTCDIAQSRRPEERRALVESGMSAVFFRKGFTQTPLWDQARLAVNAWPAVIHRCDTCRAPTVFEVGGQMNGKVDEVCKTADLQQTSLKAHRKR